jgi:hypothetical protein
MVFLTSSQRFHQVFGTMGVLHFLSPFLPFEGPKIEEGYRRLITYNSDHVVDGMLQMNKVDSDGAIGRDEQISLMNNAY